jgi:outer membrane protein TolC
MADRIIRKKIHRPAMLALAAALAVSVTGSFAAAEEVREDSLAITLGEAIGLGFSSDELLRQAGQAVEGARAGIKEARSGRIPRLDLSAQYGRNILKPVLFLPSEMAEEFGGVTKIEMGEDNDFSAVAAASWNLWTGGRVSSMMDAASEIAEAALQNETTVENYVRFRVKEAYYGVLLAEANVLINERAYESTEEAVRVANAGRHEGTVSRFDLLRATVELENRHAPLIKARNDLEQALLVLKRRCGLDPDLAVSLSDTLGRVGEPESLELLLSDMKEASSEIKALEHHVQAARFSLDFEKSERWPSLQLGASYMFQSQWSGQAFPESNNIAHSSAVTIGLVYPLFDGQRAKARIDRAEADLRSGEIELERLLREKGLAVRVSRLTLVNSITALDGRREAVELAEEAYRLAEIRLTNGLATPLERLDAELALTTARGQYVQALHAANMAEAALELTIGAASPEEYGDGAGKESGDE